MLNWIDERSFSVGDIAFTLDHATGGSKRTSQVNDFTMIKTSEFLDTYCQLQDGRYERILELGVYQGGSLVFMDRLLKPKKISAVELSQVPVPALDIYASENSDRVRVHYGTSQDDVERLGQIVDEDFGGELDLVVDDASHFYEQTRTSFATLFPKLRPGGLYVIEDWSWSFYPASQDPENGWFNQTAPVNLIIDLMEDLALNNAIAEINVSLHIIQIRKALSSCPGIPFKASGRRGREDVKL